MSLTVLQFNDILEAGSGDPIYPPVKREVGIALDAWYPLADMVRGVLVYNAGSVPVHLRVSASADSPDKADQNDPLIPTDGTAYFLIQRKSRNDDNKLYVYATADT